MRSKKSTLELKFPIQVAAPINVRLFTSQEALLSRDEENKGTPVSLIDLPLGHYALYRDGHDKTGDIKIGEYRKSHLNSVCEALRRAGPAIYVGLYIHPVERSN
mgnify:CR=1 FL=1